MKMGQEFCQLYFGQKSFMKEGEMEKKKSKDEKRRERKRKKKTKQNIEKENRRTRGGRN